jgi:hypothetical protein
MAITSERTRTPEEVMLARLRVVGLGIIAAAVVIDAFAGPLARWRGFRTRVLSDLDPLDPPGTTLLVGVADLLSATNGSAPARERSIVHTTRRKTV